MTDNLQFVVMVDGVDDENDLINELASMTTGPRKHRSSFTLNGNFVELWSNDRADAELAADGERAYLHYAWRVEATPVEPVSEEDQVEFARALAARLAATRNGARTEILANFEHLL